MNKNQCDCKRDDLYNEEYIASGFSTEIDEGEGWWDAMNDFQYDGEIVILELINYVICDHQNCDVDCSVNSPSYNDLSGCLKLIGHVKMRNYTNLIKILGKKEVQKLKENYFECDDEFYKNINYAILLYHKKDFCTITFGSEPHCI